MPVPAFACVDLRVGHVKGAGGKDSGAVPLTRVICDP